MDDIDTYERPVTLYDLLARWAERDDIYARRSRTLTAHEVEGIKIGRKQEAGFLPPAERARAWAHVATWYPPEHGR